jgi:hypothetical protein
MEKFENEFIHFHIEDEILHCFYKKQAIIELSVAKQIADDRIRFTKGKSYPVLVDVTNIKTGSKSAREFLADPHGGLKGVTAGAFLSDRIVSVVLINLFLKINTPPIPSKFFTKKEHAIKWLKSINQKM